MSLKRYVHVLMVLALLIPISIFANTRVLTVSSNSDAVSLKNNSRTGFELNFNIQKLEISEVSTKAGVFDQINVPGFGYTGRIGEPKLPAFSKLIAVPVGANVTFELITKNQQILSKDESKLANRIIPAQLSVSKSENPELVAFNLKASAYERNAFSDNELFKVEEVGYMRGVRVFRFDYEPLQYNPITGEIKVCLEANIKVNFVNPDFIATKDLLDRTGSVEYDAMYGKLFYNWMDGERVNNNRYPTKILILCPPTYTSTMQTYIDWKKQQGYTVILTTVGTGGTVANTTAAINTYMASVWSAATAENPAPTYLLIVGDTATTGDNIIANTGASGTHVTDLTYVRLQGTDYLPEMYYGRFSVSSSTELTNIINKSITFQKTLMPDLSYLGKAVMIAGVDASYAPTYGNGQINYGTTHYFNETNGITSNTYLYPASGSSDAAILANANEGRGYMNYTAHGGETSWADPTFTVSDVNAMTNTNKYGVMVGNCCITNKFNYSSPCFGEAIIRKANGGGVNYIGATNNSYWDEDYWWGIGYKTPIQATAHAYSSASLGAYDAMFHTHSEAFTNWATTVGEINVMGNTAVEQSTSSRKPYYWEIYTIMGDPTTMPYLGVPTVNTATFPSTILVGATSINVTATPYSRVALTMGGTLYGTALVPAGGTLTLPITPFSTVGTAKLVITAQNKITRIEDITIAPNTGAYLTVEANTYNDANNNVAEYNETGRFTTTFKNVGSVASGTTTATLTCATAGITITDGSESIAALAAGASVVKTNAFSFTVANNIVNQLSAAFTITMVSGSDTWVHNFTQVFNAPALAFGSMSVSDPTGNNNGRLDPGETVTITMPLSNIGGAASVSGSGTLSSSTTGITINSGTSAFAAIAAGGSANLSFSITASSSMSIGTVASLVFNATAGSYTASKTEATAVGIIQEDFESGNFNAFQWSMGGTLPWTIDNTGAHGGTYAAKSGTITHSQSSTMEVTRVLSSAGTITFWYKVSSESSYDYLKFYIDGTVQSGGTWSGTVDWTQASFPVTAGTRILKWEYMKDSSVSSGSDCAWIDDIVFPTSTGASTFYPPTNLAATVSHQSVALTWSAPSSGTPTGYKVFKNSNVLTTVTALTYTDTAVTNGTSYAYYVKAVYSGGESEATATVNATPIALPPSNLAATVSHQSVNLTWTAPTLGTPTGYKVFKNSTLLTTVTALTYTDTAVTNGTAYSYYVTAVYSGGESAATATVNATPNAIAPTNLTATAGNAVVALSWTAATGRGNESFSSSEKDDRAISGYKVYRNGSALTTLTTTTYTDTAVTNETTYSYYVTTVYSNPAGESSASNTVQATPTSVVPTEAIIGTATTVTGNTTASPVNVYYKSLHGQAVYTAAELNAAGIVGPIQITQLGFNIASLPTVTMPNFVVRMKHTTATNVATFVDATNLVTVYSNASYMPTATGWNMYTFSTPFTWNGTDNILVDTAFGLFTVSYAQTGTVQYTSLANGYRAVRSDTADQTNVFTGGTASEYRPNAKFRFQALAVNEPNITLSTTSLSYPETAVNGNSSLSFTIYNTGTATLTGSITTPAGFNVSQRSGDLQGIAERNTINFSINAGANREYTVLFTPTQAIAYSGNISINSNAVNTPNASVAVSGTGYIPATISLNAGSLSASLNSGDTGNDSFTITNIGSRSLTYTFTLAEIRSLTARDYSDRSIAGSTLTVDPEVYLPGTTADFTISAFNASTDTEWLKEVIVTFPAGITINSASDMTGGTAAMIPTVTDNSISWYGVTTSNYGLIQGNQTGIATVNITIPSDFSGTMSLPFELIGDVWGADPHTLSGTAQIAQDVPPVEWVSLSIMSGTLAGGASEQITATFSAVNMDEGTYTAMLTINSNDTAHPVEQLEIIMEVFGNSNHAPIINMPATFSFDKGSSLQLDISDYASDSDNDPLTVQVSGNTNIDVNISGLIVTLSSANWIGTETLNFTVSDGILTASDTAAITVNPVNLPEWVPVQYPNNPATIYANVVIEGFPAQDGDWVAAFVGNECRGTAAIVISRETASATIVVHLASPNEMVYFKVYSYATDTIFDANISVEPEFGEEIGETEPIVIEAGELTTLNKPVVNLTSASGAMALSWNVVLHADYYMVLACDTPYGEFLPIGTTTTTSYPLTPANQKKFYCVKAVKGTPAK